MEITFESSSQFEQDLAKFNPPEQRLILDELHQASPLLLTQRLTQERRLHQFYEFKFTDGYESSLYSFIVNYYIRVILTLDQDPLFERNLITLLRVINIQHQNATSIYQEVGEALYKNVLG
ncbi:MAG: hypothetical protein HC835_18655 [Oscillatoriales cyanobacterium RM2_1_1]|nr:hypothetical protein [Oscillatoriales cyanobacterium RM2_1_1]